MDSPEWEVEQTEDYTKITVPVEPQDSTTAAAPTQTTATNPAPTWNREKYQAIRDAARDVAAERGTRGKTAIPALDRHVHDYTELVHKNVGADKVMLLRECGCGAQKAFELLSSDKARVLYARLKGIKV